MALVASTPDAPALADAVVGDLYRAHWHGLVRLAWLLLHDDQEAEEVVQDAFVATHRHFARLRDTSSALPYLRRCVVNKARSALRHRGVEERYVASLAARPSLRVVPSAEEEALAHLGDAAVLRALNALSPRQREVLVLRYYLDWSEEQIADALGLARGSVKAHAHRALASLRATLDSPEHPTGRPR